MRQQYKIVCRGSALSRAQAEIFRSRVEAVRPGTSLDLIIKETRGDANPDIPLDSIEGKDFFTQDIHDFLVAGQADFAVHSLKDVSGENFFKGTHYAIIDRDDPRDVAIFRSDIENVLRQGKPVRIGTSSPRRSAMATDFLQRALPHTPATAIMDVQPIRGNVDTRLRKLHSGDYDAIILACAGLNRLLRAGNVEVGRLLQDKLTMVLPLLHCPPAPGQGAIVVESIDGNTDASILLQQINKPELATEVLAERKIAHTYGAGCHQQFGVVHLEIRGKDFTFAAGTDRSGRSFREFYDKNGRRNASPVAARRPSEPDANLVASYAEGLALSQRPDNRIWTADTDVWFELAIRGLWVQGSAEGMGREFISYSRQSPIATATRAWIQSPNAL